MTWTYYRQDHPNGVWTLFREDEHGREELFHRQLGWQPSNELSRRRAAGAVDRTDLIPEAEAEALLRAHRTE